MNVNDSPSVMFKSTTVSIEHESFTESNTGKYTFKKKLFATLRKYLWLFPLAIFISIPTLCFTIYASAIHYGHIEPLLPFVSDAGTTAPQAGFFAQTMDVIAILTLFTTVGRYKQIKYYIRVRVPTSKSSNQLKAFTQFDSCLMNRLDKFNFVASLIAYLNCFNLLVTGNFRCSEEYTLHTIGAASLFLGIILYGYYMAYISHHLSTKFDIESRPVTMAISVAIGFVSFVACIIFNVISVHLFGHDKYFDNYARLHWKSTDPGYLWHVLGTGFEWVTINSFPLMYLCFCRRMKVFKDWDKVQF